LIANEGETCAKFQQEMSYIFNQFIFYFTFQHTFFEGKKIKNIFFTKGLNGKFALGALTGGFYSYLFF